jgi:diadenosine tetraphosphate (Ap4A) HIT family hydrolase
MIDHKDTFYSGKISSRICLFCEPKEGMILLETDHFRLIADTYPIIPGHLMISSKAHYSSGGEVASQLHKELLQMKTHAKQIALEMNDSCLFYEHGKAGQCHAQSSENVHCEHFHMHCLPASVCIHSKIAERFTGIPMNNFAEIFVNYQKYGSYLFFENSKGEMYYYPAEQHEVPPHFLRTLICEELKVHHLADWQAYDDLDRSLTSKTEIAFAMQMEPLYALL